MADEKKPKIDLKARLGKQGGATPPPPMAGGGLPMPGGPVPGPAVAPPPGGGMPGPGPAGGGHPMGGGQMPGPQPQQMQKPGGGLPVPPGIPVGPPPAFRSPGGMNLDPSNPLAAAMAQPQQAPARAAAPPQPQRIEVDELTVQEARKGARKQGLVAGVIFGCVLAAVGYIAGGAQETSKGRNASVQHAKALAVDVQKSHDQLKMLAEKLEAGRTVLGQRKFPDTLPKDLGGINVDFDGQKLAGVRFSGFSQDTTSGLIEFISGVQSTNDRKNALINLLTKLQKPMTEQLAQAAANKAPPINFVVLINKDTNKNVYGILAPLQKPVELANLPAEYTATDPLSHSNVVASKLTTLDKPGAAYVIPKSLESACPSETTGQLGQLASQLSRLITDIRGEQAAAENMDSKPGLLDRSDKLVAGLNRVQ